MVKVLGLLAFVILLLFAGLKAARKAGINEAKASIDKQVKDEIDRLEDAAKAVRDDPGLDLNDWH